MKLKKTGILSSAIGFSYSAEILFAEMMTRIRLIFSIQKISPDSSLLQ